MSGSRMMVVVTGAVVVGLNEVVGAAELVRGMEVVRVKLITGVVVETVGAGVVTDAAAVVVEGKIVVVDVDVGAGAMVVVRVDWVVNIGFVDVSAVLVAETVPEPHAGKIDRATAINRHRERHLLLFIRATPSNVGFSNCFTMDSRCQ